VSELVRASVAVMVCEPPLISVALVVMVPAFPPVIESGGGKVADPSEEVKLTVLIPAVTVLL